MLYFKCIIGEVLVKETGLLQLGALQIGQGLGLAVSLVQPVVARTPRYTEGLLCRI